MNGKTFHVVFVDKKTEDSFDALEEGKFEDRKLHKFIERAIQDLKRDPTIGTRVPKRLIPKEYSQKFSINNLWKYNLPGAWRLLYTLKGNDVEIISIILEWLSHPEYEKLFKY